MKFRRILLKLSGEVLAGTAGSGISFERIRSLAEELVELHGKGVEIGLVVGGGNLFRGGQVAMAGLDRVTGDHMGMLATVMNSLALQDALEKCKVPTRVMTAIRMDQVAEPFIRRRAVRHLEKGRIVLMAAGTGNPYFTTDTAGVLRAVEIGADVILKGTKVDGVYDADPQTTPNANRYETLSYQDVLSQNLKVMDASAVSLSRENDLPIIVFDINKRGDLLRIVQGETVGTLVGKG